MNNDPKVSHAIKKIPILNANYLFIAEVVKLH